MLEDLGLESGPLLLLLFVYGGSALNSCVGVQKLEVDFMCLPLQGSASFLESPLIEPRACVLVTLAGQQGPGIVLPSPLPTLGL